MLGKVRIHYQGRNPFSFTPYITLYIHDFLPIFIKILPILDEEIQLGLIDNDSGGVGVIVWYTAVFFRPFSNQVMDAIVVSANNTEGFVCRVGPLDIFVSRHVIFPLF